MSLTFTPPHSIFAAECRGVELGEPPPVAHALTHGAIDEYAGSVLITPPQHILKTMEVRSTHYLAAWNDQRLVRQRMQKHAWRRILPMHASSTRTREGGVEMSNRVTIHPLSPT
jgi:hypothetical protein